MTRIRIPITAWSLCAHRCISSSLDSKQDESAYWSWSCPKISWVDQRVRVIPAQILTVTKESKANQWQRSGLSSNRLALPLYMHRLGLTLILGSQELLNFYFIIHLNWTKKDSSKPKKKKKKDWESILIDSKLITSPLNKESSIIHYVGKNGEEETLDELKFSNLCQKQREEWNLLLSACQFLVLLNHHCNAIL
jgi:hypothetical protein